MVFSFQSFCRCRPRARVTSVRVDATLNHVVVKIAEILERSERLAGQPISHAAQNRVPCHAGKARVTAASPAQRATKILAIRTPKHAWQTSLLMRSTKEDWLRIT